MTQSPAPDLAALVSRDLPYLRRYARALTGCQEIGDRFALAALEEVLAAPAILAEAAHPKVALFAILHRAWLVGGAPAGVADSTLSAAAQAHMAKLTPNTREALLLRTIEGFTLDQIGQILGVDPDEAGQLIERAFTEMQDSVLGRVLVIEDEAIIALDISAIVEGMGHTVTGVARTRDEAVDMARAENPDLVLADIQLADNSSGIDAVNDILARVPDLPVIFITAFPERLLTGERPEPAFMINKPYTEEQVRSAVSQAMFFASTETLGA